MARIRQVREHDGTLSPYRERKVAEAIHQALKESGSDDRELADELAGVVSLFLERTHPEPSVPPLVAEIQDTIERVLRETGNEAAARRFQKGRRIKEQVRDQISVRSTALRSAHDVRLPDEAGGDLAIAKWSRTRLVRSLTEGDELPAPLAEEIASAVEKKVFGLELRSVSAELIRHLVECELFERGLQTGDRASERIPISNRALAAGLFAESGDAPPPSPLAFVAGPVLAHFALSELHGAAVANAHAEAVVHVHGLENPLAIERLALPVALVPARRGGTPSLLDLRRTLDAIRPHVAGTIELVDALPWALREGRDPERAVDELVDAVTSTDVHGRPAGPAIEISAALGAAPGAGDLPGLDAAIRMLAGRAEEAPRGALRVRFLHRDGFAPASAGALERAFELLRTDPFAAIDFGRDDGGARPGALRFSLARVTLNLPLLLMDAKGTGLKEALASLDRGARLALDAFQERAWAQRKGGSGGLSGIVGLLGQNRRLSVPAGGQEADLEVWGLAHALELLVRRGVIARAEVQDAAARVLGHLQYHLGEERDGVQLAVRFGGCTSRAVRKRLLEACEANGRRLGVKDLLSELRNERAPEGVIPLAIPLSDRRNRPLVTSRTLFRLGPGLGVPEVCIPGGLSWDALAAIRTSTGLGALHLAPKGSVGLFEVQEELFGQPPPEN